MSKALCSSFNPIPSHLITSHIVLHHLSCSDTIQDLSISVTSFAGDPDIFVSLAPVTHPTRHNYTWVAASQGSDSLTLQVLHMTPFHSLSLSLSLSLSHTHTLSLSASHSIYLSPSLSSSLSVHHSSYPSVR